MNLVLTLILTCTGLSASNAERPNPAARGFVPIIYTTDLYHPHDDPDDHFDLATLMAIPEFSVRAVVIDTGPNAARAGLVPLRQIMHITGRTVPYATGLTANLRSQEDRAEQQPAAAQAGVQLILKAIGESDRQVTLFTAGSLRDVAAAYNRQPELFHAKVARLYLNIGHTGGADEWNVKLDPHAFVRILGAPLPVYWVPCFGADGYFSYWAFRQGDVLETAPPMLQAFFAYALNKTSPKDVDPIKALREPIPEPLRKKIWDENRSMWCTAAFLHAAGRTDATFTFKKINVHLDNNGASRITTGTDGLSVMTFHHADADRYAVSMRQTLKTLCQGLASPPDPRASGRAGDR